MHPWVQLKNATLLSFIIFVLLCLTLLPAVQALSPAPDGGYPGGNTAEGQKALFSLTTGGFNTAVGWLSLETNTTGQFNTGVGAGALDLNTGDQNTAVGAAALLLNTTGAGNTAIGAAALESNIEGSGNTAIGSGALMHMNINSTGSSNTAVGHNALAADTSGVGNTAVGSGALYMSTTGDSNTVVGLAAGSFLTTGGANIILGADAGNGISTTTGTICIGTVGNNVDNACYIGNIFSSTSSGGAAVFVNTNGRLGTMTSSARFKEHIEPMGDASKALFSLEPVSFRYKKGVDPEGPEGKSEFGLVAEDVEKVNPDLVVRDKEGKPYSVRYDAVNAMLLNEFLKEHKKVEEQQATIADLKSTVAQQQKGFESTLAKQEEQIEALTAGLQKVSAQLEVSKPVPQTVLNNQ